MRPSQPSKLQSVVVGILVAAAVGFVFMGRGNVAVAADGGTSFNISNPSECAAAADKIDKSAAAAVAACSQADGLGNFNINNKKDRDKCLANFFQCNLQQGKTLQESGDTNGDDCANLVKYGCADLGGTAADLKQQKTDASKARQDLVKQKDDNAKAAMDAANQAQQKSDQLNDKLAQDDQQWQQNRLKAQRDLQTALSGMDDQRAKAVKEAQQKYDEISANYVKLRDQLRRKSSNASNLKLSWDVQCRAAANQAGKDTEKAFNDRMDAEAKMQINYALSTAAGRNNRLLKMKRAKILDAYNTMLSRCLQGVDGPGVQIKLNLDNAQKDVLDSSAQANDQAAVMENQRKETLADMQSLASSLGKKTQQLILNTSQDVAMLDQNHMTNQTRLGTQAMQAQQQAGQQQQVQAAQAQNIDNDLKAARADEASTSAKLKCGTSISKEDASSAKSDRKAAMPSLHTFDVQCTTYAKVCKESDGHPQPGLCPTVAAALQSQDIKASKGKAVAANPDDSSAPAPTGGGGNPPPQQSYQMPASAGGPAQPIDTSSATSVFGHPSVLPNDPGQPGAPLR